MNATRENNMELDKIKEITEIVRTWNVNVDSDTSIELVKSVKPLIYLYLFRGILSDIITTFVILTICFFGYKLLKHMVDEEHKDRRKN